MYSRSLPKRLVRKLRRHLGLLPCEWCGRYGEPMPGIKWSMLPIEDWYDYATSHQVYVCRRELCQQRHNESGGLRPERGKLVVKPA